MATTKSEKAALNLNKATSEQLIAALQQSAATRGFLQSQLEAALAQLEAVKEELRATKRTLQRLQLNGAVAPPAQPCPGAPGETQPAVGAADAALPSQSSVRGEPVASASSASTEPTTEDKK